MPRDERCRTDRDQRSHVIVRDLRDSYDPQEHQQVDQQHRCTADEPELFGNRGEDEVVGLLSHEVPRLGDQALPETGARHATQRDGLARITNLSNLVAVALGERRRSKQLEAAIAVGLLAIIASKR